MPFKVGLIYNEPVPDRYSEIGEADAVADVIEQVNAVEIALKELGHSVVRLPLLPPLDEVRRKIGELDVDVVFNVFEGFAGSPETEAMVAGMLAASGIPYTGSNPATLALTLDKAKTKELLMAAGVDTPRYRLLLPETCCDFDLNYPCIVKPAAEDASHGVGPESVVHDAGHLEAQIARICAGYGGRALVEEFIDGRELSTTIMGNRKLQVLSASEIVYSLPPGMPRVLTFAAKWLPGDIYFDNTDPVCPATVDDELMQRLSFISLRAYRLAGCRGYGRVDMRVDSHGRPFVLEINANPDISLTSGATHQAEAIGLTYPQFIEKILRLAFDEE